MWVTWDHHQWIVLQYLQCCCLCVQHTSMNIQKIKITQNTTIWYIQYSQLKFSDVSNVRVLRPSPMYCAPISPILLTVYPHITHTYSINTQSTHTTHISHNTLTTQNQCCKWCESLETFTNGLCSNVFNAVTCTSTSTNTHISSTHNQHTPAHITHHSPYKSSVVSDVSDLRPLPIHCAPMCPILLSVHPHANADAFHQHSINTDTHHTSLTAQIQCCKWCEWLETITNGLCSNVPYSFFWFFSNNKADKKRLSILHIKQQRKVELSLPHLPSQVQK